MTFFFFWNFLRIEIFLIPSCHILEIVNKNYDKKYLIGSHDALKIYGAPKLCSGSVWNYCFQKTSCIFLCKISKIVKSCNNLNAFLSHTWKKWIWEKFFLDIMMHQRFTGHQSYVLLCTETTLSNPPVVHFWVKYQKL